MTFLIGPLIGKQIFGLVHAALLSKGIENGLGRHMLYLTPSERIRTLKYVSLLISDGDQAHV